MESIKKEHPLFIVLLGIVTGIGISPLVDTGFSFAFLCGYISLCFLILHGIYKHTSIRLFLFLCVFCIGISIGIFRYAVKDFVLLPESLLHQVSQTVSIEGIIVAEPRDRGSLFQYEVYAPLYDERLIVRAERLPQFEYGDSVLFTGTLSRPVPFISDSGKTVQYDKILSRHDVYFVLDRAQGVIISSGNGNTFRSVLFRMKEHFIQNLERVIHEPYATFVSGVVFGSDNTLGDHADTMFRTAGISHIVVLSGYNLTLVASIIFFLFRSQSIHVRVIVASVAIVLFAVMAGGGASVVRATIMSMCVLVAHSIGRTRGIGRVFVLTGACMLMLNPKLLYYDLGFQLSFLATAGLIWVSPWVHSISTWIPERYGVRDVVTSTISAQIAVLPLLVYSIGTISPWALIPNILVLPFIPILMCVAILIGLIAFIHPILTFPLASIAWIISLYVFFVAEVSSTLPFASMHANGFVLSVLGVLYGWGVWRYVVFMRTHAKNYSR